jgi:DNA-binding CsgD family transcriptional regulator
MNKEKSVLKMIKDGKSYTDIQLALNVSPSRISLIKKKYKIQKNTK